MPQHVYPGFWDNLSQAEQMELVRINTTIKQWIMYCEMCRHKKTKQPIDYSKEPSKELYLRREVLRDKFFLPKEVKNYEDHFNRAARVSGEADSLSLLRLNSGIRPQRR